MAVLVTGEPNKPTVINPSFGLLSGLVNFLVHDTNAPLALINLHTCLFSVPKYIVTNCLQNLRVTYIIINNNGFQCPPKAVAREVSCSELGPPNTKGSAVLFSLDLT